MNLPIVKRKIFLAINKYFVLVIIALALIILAGGYFLLIKDKVAEINDIGAVDLTSKQNLLASRQQVKEKLEALNAKYGQITEDQLRQLDYILPHQSEIPYLVIEIQNFVKNSNLTLDAIDVGPLSINEAEGDEATAADNIRELNFTLTVSGFETYDSLKDFLDSLSTNLPLIELTSLVYTPEVDSYTLNLTTYYQ